MASRPARTIADGVDLSQRIRSAADLRAAGKTFAVRYVSPNTVNHPSKQLTAAELADCHAHDVAVAVVWETTTNRAGGTRADGRADAHAAANACTMLGLPDDMPIHWAIDFDASGVNIDSYARGWYDVLDVARIGAYGGIRPLAYLLDLKLITYAWQTFAWSNGELEPRATAYQWHNDVTVAGNNCDLDAALAHDFGQWPRPTNPPDQGVDMALDNADANTVWTYKPSPAWPGLPNESPLGMLGDTLNLLKSVSARLDTVLGDENVAATTLTALTAAETDEAAAIAAVRAEQDVIHAELASLPAAMAALLPPPGPGGTYTLADVQAAAAAAVTGIISRTTAALTVAPPAAGSGS